MINICEIFASIQGESTLQGMPCIFVRLAGCNLDCVYCDTPYARADGTPLSIEVILSRVRSFGIGFVCVTGGEPLCQNETPDLVDSLLTDGYRVSVETNGSFDAGILPENCIRIIDVKCPGSGEEKSFNEQNILERRPSDEFKFVVSDRNDFEYTRRFVSRYGLENSTTILVSPVSGQLDTVKLAEWLLTELPCARLNLQLHRYIWPDESRGR